VFLVQEISDQSQDEISRENQDQISTKNQNPISRPDQGNPDNQFDCPECGKAFGAQKSVEAHMLRSHRIKPSSLGGGTGATGKVSNKDDGESLVADIRAENTVASNQLLLSRNKSRLRQQDPHEFSRLYGHEEDGSPTRAIVDLEVAKTLRAMRQEEPSHQNNGDSNETALLKKEVTDLKEALRQKDLQSLRDENAKINEELKEIRSEMRSLPNSSSDLAALVKSTENIIIKAVESEGPLRRYLIPDGTIPIKAPGDAPLLRVQPAGNNVLEELKKHGLVTRVGGA
jgi:hypothetical protein